VTFFVTARVDAAKRLGVNAPVSKDYSILGVLAQKLKRLVSNFSDARASPRRALSTIDDWRIALSGKTASREVFLFRCRR
jgi:hypothetical protein